jgi:hypothetical protein
LVHLKGRVEENNDCGWYFREVVCDGVISRAPPDYFLHAERGFTASVAGRYYADLLSIEVYGQLPYMAVAVWNVNRL